MERAADTEIWIAAGGYLLALTAIGLWAWRRTRNERDFFIAGQRAGLWAIGLATMAASFSSFVFLGGPGLMVRAGLGALFIILPVGFTAGLLCRVVGGRLRQLSGAGVLTIPGALDARFPGGMVRGLSAIAILLGSVAYLGLQLQGMAIVLRSVLGVSHPDLALGIGLIVVVGYSITGGMVAGLYTDVLQGVLMAIAAVVVFARAMHVGGGWGAITSALAASGDGSFLEPTGTLPAMTVLGFFLVFGVGVLGQPHLLHKFYMIRDPQQLRYLPLVFGGSQIVCLLLWLGIGLTVPALVAQGRLDPLTNPDLATPVFLIEYMPGVVAGLLVAAILAAVMSTADSFLNIGAAALVRDLPRAFNRPLANELRWARWAVPGIALVALLFSRVYADLIALVGTFAFGAFAAALAPALALGLWWRRVTSTAAAASIVTGLTVCVVLEFLVKQTWFEGLPRPTLSPGALPSAVALAASFVVLFVVTWAGPDPG
jgi:Na+/proline symporter